MSMVRHVPVATAKTDTVGTVRLCGCCQRPWVYRKILSPFGPMQEFAGTTVLVWTPETLRERIARRWWQFKARFKGPSERVEHPSPSGHMWEIETTTTETYHPTGREDVAVTKKKPETFPYVPRADETVVSEEMKKKVWEE